MTATAERLEKAVGGKARLRVVVLLACVLALDSADKATVGAVATELESSLHIGNTDIGLLVTVSTAVGVFATLPVGLFVDRVDRTKLLAASILLWCGAMIVSGLSTSYLMLLFTRLALGAVVATAGPAVASLTGDYFPAVERGRIYGFILTGELVGAGFGFLVAGNVASIAGWRPAFWVLAVPGVVLAWAIWRILPEPARGGQSRLRPGATTIRSAEDVEDGPPPGPDPGPRDGAEPSAVEQEVVDEGIRPHDDLVLHGDPTGRSLWWAVRYVLSIRTNVFLIVASALGYFYFTGLRTFAVVFLRGRFDLGQSSATTLLVVLGAGAIVGVLVAGRLADRLIERGRVTARPVVGGVALLAAAGLLVPALLVPTLLLAAPLLFLAAGALGGVNPPLDAARLDFMHSRLWGRAEGVRTVLRTSFEAAAPLVFGYVSTLFGGHGGGFGHPASEAVHGGLGLDRAALLMVVAPIAAAVIALVWGRRSYPRDVATAVASEEHGVA